MKIWVKAALGAAIAAAFAVNAQNAQERKALQSVMDTSALEQLAAEFQARFEITEAQVRKYLVDNPTVQRTQVIDGRKHTIVRIDAAGNPQFQVARDGAISGFNGSKNLASGQLIKADSLYSGGSVGVNITGTGMVAGVWEPGIPRVTHELLTGKVTVAAGQSAFAVGEDGDHASHVTGTMIGRNVATHPSARGIAFDGTSINYDAANDLTEMTGFASGGGLVSNHSYGDSNKDATPANQWKYGAYDTEAKDWDVLLKTATNYLPFIAAGNEQTTNGNTGKAGYDIMTGPATSKNTMTVGAINGDKTMSSYSNWGPTDDGRVKPEIVAKGTGIDSAQSASDTAYSGNDALTSSGTSYSSPAAAAGGLLLQQYYRSVKGQFMKASTLKTLMMGTAEDLGQPGPDHKFGYGLLNVEAAALAIKKSILVTTLSGATLATSRGAAVVELATNPPNNSASESQFDVYAKGGVPLVINLGWTDNEGVEQVAGDGVDPTTSRLVYNFDIMVRNTTTFADVRPWVLPSMANRTANATLATNWFQANGGNFRQVIIPNPTPNQQYRVYIRKSSSSPSAVRTLSFVVTGTAESPANGVCGSANGVPITVTPNANLCTDASTPTVNSGATSFSWTCAGVNGGSNTSCAAPRQYTVTASAGANGTLSCTSTTVTSGGTTSCTAVPASGFVTASISGCDGTTTGSGVNAYTTGPVNANCTVSATFAAAAVPVNAACGTANNAATTVAPTANLCADASAPSVSSGASSFSWTCAGSNGGTSASCAAPRQYTVTTSAGANGTLSCTSTTVTSGGTTTCTATPASGFSTASISGCGGTATASGVNAYTTGPVNANCTVSATFAAVVVPVNGACGTANNAATTVAPTANLCADASTPSVTSGASSFSWTCAGSNGGTSASCTAPRQYTVTASAGANGTLSCTSTTVTSGGTTTCTATPAVGFSTASISGCSGTATGSGVNAYSTGPVTANCTVSATFAAVVVPVNGACGTANAVATTVAPTANLCADASTPSVTSGASSFTWTCAGSNGGTSASCTAPRQYTVTASAGANGTLSCTNTAITSGGTTTCTAVPASGFVTTSISGCSGTATASGVNAYTTGPVTANCTVSASFAAAPATSITGPTSANTGNATASISGGGATCGYAAGTARFTTIAPPSGFTLPQGVFQFTANNCTVGSTLTVTVVYPQALPAGVSLQKFGPTPSNLTPHWYAYPATIAGNTITYQVTDGGAGDSDGVANGTIVDPAGPVLAAAVVQAAEVVPVPTLNAWALLLLALSLGAFGWSRARRSM